MARKGPELPRHESITVSSASKELTATKYGTLQYAVITCEGAAVRWWPDGATTAPTSSLGHELLPRGGLILDSHQLLVNIRFIRRDGINATLRVSYGA